MKTAKVIDVLQKYKINDKKFSNDILNLVSQVYSKDLQLIDGFRNFLFKFKQKSFYWIK